MKFKEQEELVRDLRDLADFYERPESIILPRPYISLSHTVNEGTWGENYSEFKYDHEASLAKIKRFVRALGSCEKDWGSESLYVKKAFGKIKLTFTVSREAVCRKVVTGTKKVPMTAYVEIPGKFEEVEEVDWVCEDVALLS